MSQPSVVNDALVDGIRTRSDEAFGALYRLVAPDLLSFANGMLRDRGAAEDAVQQAFLELARAAPTIKGDGRSLCAWLYRSVRFSCLDEIRRRERHPERPVEEVPDRIALVSQSVDGDPTLHAALMRLNPRHRAVLVLRHVIGHSFDEIAEILDTNRTAAYAISARAERRLRRELMTVESLERATSEQLGRQDESRNNR